jgi:hypothetical protein
LNLLTHNAKKLIPKTTIRKALITGVIINPFKLNDTPDLMSSGDDKFSMCKTMNLKAEVV